MLCHHFQRLTVFLVHGKKEERQHHCHHAKCSKAQISAGFEQKENRNANQRTGSEAENLPFGQVILTGFLSVRISLVDEPAGMYDEVSENTGSLEPPVCSVR